MCRAYGLKSLKSGKNTKQTLHKHFNKIVAVSTANVANFNVSGRKLIIVNYKISDSMKRLMIVVIAIIGAVVTSWGPGRFANWSVMQTFHSTL